MTPETAVRDTTARVLDKERIPVIDITPLHDGTNPDAVAAALLAASRNLGFIYVAGHSIQTTTIDRARCAAYEFFRAPDAVKETVSVSPHHRGWLRQGGAKMQDDAAVDLKESFIWGHEDVGGFTESDHPLRGPNQWPAEVPAMQHAAMAYLDAAHEVAYSLMRGFARGLDLSEDFFLRRCSRPISRASFVYYPPQPDTGAPTDADGKPGPRFGVGPHTDFGVLTVLCQDDVGGLQVQDVNGDWLQAPPIDGTLVVNVGDLLSRWTDGAFVSTPHRVINTSGRERLSLVLAFDPDPDTLIDARQVFGSDYTPASEPITCGDYLVQRFARAFAYRKS